MVLVLVDEAYREAFDGCILPQLQDELDDARSIAYGLLDDTGAAVAVAMGKVRGDWLELLWVYVQPPYRTRDLGHELTDRLVKAAENVGLVGVVAEYLPSESTERLEYALEQDGFVREEDESGYYVVTLDQLAESDLWKKPINTGSVVPLGETAMVSLRQLEHTLQSKTGVVALDVPVDWNDFLPDVSMVCIHDKEVCGLLLMREGDPLELAFAWTSSKTRTALPQMLYRAGHAALKRYPRETGVSIAAIDPVVPQLVEKLIPEARQMPVRRLVYRY